jgi:hypothetical protein
MVAVKEDLFRAPPVRGFLAFQIVKYGRPPEFTEALSKIHQD